MADPIRWSVAEPWNISYYEATRGCLAYATFEGTGIFIGFDTLEDVPALDITLLDNRWQSIEPGVSYPVSLTFGNNTPWVLDMAGVHMDGAPGLHILIDATMDRSATFIEEFQSEMKMRWAYADTTLGEFTLRGSRQAFQQVVDCQAAHAEPVAAPPSGLPANAEAVSTAGTD
ncbi:MAG: hypothetical protein VXW58_13420 [Pseudomonadota bacterium]|nr:hypothetical protein [Pseudomonadota bacterium]